MALTVEDGTGLAAADAYSELADADTYHAARGNTTWAALADADKEVYIREATTFADEYNAKNLRGRRASRDQGLAFPRMNVIDSEGYEWDVDEVPTAWKQSIFELALIRATADLWTDEAAGGRLKTLKAGSVTLEWDMSSGREANWQHAKMLAQRFLVTGTTRRVVR